MLLLNTSWLLLYFFICPSTVKGQILSTTDDSLDLATTVLYLATEHITRKTNTVVIAEHSLTPETRAINIFLMEYLLLEMDGKLSVQLYFSERLAQPREYYIFITDSVEAFRIMRSGFAANKNNRHFYFLIILTLVEEDFEDVMKGIFQLCLEMNVYDVNIILKHPREGVCMFKLLLFTEGKCRQPVPELFFKFGHSRESLKQLEALFPRKLTNLHRCPIRISCRDISPFVFFYGNLSDPRPDKNNNWPDLDGIEGFTLKFFAEILNFTLDVLPFPRERSYAFENGTAFGCFHDLITDKADIVIGGFSASDPSHGLFSTSKMIHSSPFIYIFNPQEKLSALARFAKPIDEKAWKLLGLLLFFGLLFLGFMQLAGTPIRNFFYGPETSSPGINFIAVVLGYPVTRTPRRTFARYLLMMWMLLWFMIRNGYQGALYDAIRLDRFVELPKGFEDLVRLNYQFLISPDIEIIEIFPKNRTIVTDSVGNFDRYRILEQSTRNYATVAVQDNYLSYMSRAYFNGSSLSLVNEVIFMYQVVMFFQKNSILLDAFNRKLSELQISGVTMHMNSYHTAHPRLFAKIFESPPVKPFSNDQIVALYEIYTLMTILALVVFCLELLSKRWEWLRVGLEWIN